LASKIKAEVSTIRRTGVATFQQNDKMTGKAVAKPFLAQGTFPGKPGFSSLGR
jgi:hypothetical protein